MGKHKTRPYLAEVAVDAAGWVPTHDVSELDVRENEVQDIPLSWDIKHRDYGWRRVKRYQVPLVAPAVATRTHDPLEAL